MSSDNVTVQSETISSKTDILEESDRLPSSQSLEPSTYLVKPPLYDKFKAEVVKEIIQNVINEELKGKVFNESEVKIWASTIAQKVRDKVRELYLKRYKIIVQVEIIEQRGAGIKSCARCLWDAECDNYTSYVYECDSFYCLGIVYAVYYY